MAVAKIGWLTLRRRHAEAAETLMRAAYSYRDGGTAWMPFPRVATTREQGEREGSAVGLPKLDR